MEADVVVVGASLAGLCCAAELQQRGLNVVVLEALLRAGGRLRSQECQGFTLDAGFFPVKNPERVATGNIAWQAFMSPFYMYRGKTLTPIAYTKPLWSSLKGGWDHFKALRRFAKAVKAPLSCQQWAVEWLQSEGYSIPFITSYLFPYFRALYKNQDFLISAQMMQQCLAEDALSPFGFMHQGIESLVTQLLAKLAAGSVHYGQRVVQIEGGSVTLAGGTQIAAKAIVLAADAASCSRLLIDYPEALYHQELCLYFNAPRAPLKQPGLLFCGSKESFIHHIAVIDTQGRSEGALIAVVGAHSSEEPHVWEEDARQALSQLFGAKQIATWGYLDGCQVSYARFKGMREVSYPHRWRPGRYVCQEPRQLFSIEETLQRGMETAEAVMEDFE